MILSDEVRATHRDLSQVDLEFREIAAQDPRFLDRAQFEPLNRHELLNFRQQPWPTFLGREKLAEFQRVSLGMYHLLRALPERVFGKDYARMSTFYGLDSAMTAELLFTPPTVLPTVVSRGDMIDTADGFKCIEFNFTPNLGGWESTILVDLHLSVPATSDFISSRGLPVVYTNTVQMFLDLAIADVLAKGLCTQGEINIAFIYDAVLPDAQVPVDALDPCAQSGEHYMNQELARVLERRGGGLRGQVMACALDELTSRRGLVYRNGAPIHAIAEFTLQPSAMVFRAFKAGGLSLFNGPVSVVLGDKRGLALLSEGVDSGLFSAEEQELIRRHVPWTRLVTSGPLEFEGESMAIRDLLRTRRERFVIKEARSFGGKGVHVGKATPETVWLEAVDSALQDGRWVVQEYLESFPYLYQSGEQGCSLHDVIWGPFIFGGQYAGAILRMQPKAAGGAVNLSLAATEGVVLEV
jgi:hypothetical protein